jgi:hypothetical protein
MNNLVKGIIAITVVGGLGFVAYLVLKKKFPELFKPKDGTTPKDETPLKDGTPSKEGTPAIGNTTPNENWNLLQTQSNIMAKVDTVHPQNKEGVVTMLFNGGKNTAQFFYNNTFAIFEGTGATAKSIATGTYSNGGKDIKIDAGAKKGKNSVNAKTVAEALMQVIK